MNTSQHCIGNGPGFGGRRGFTLIELLTVIAIIALLIGILVPSLAKARDAAKRVKTQATMKGIGSSLELFVAENDRDLYGNVYPMAGPAEDPTEDETGAEIWGAQWLVRYLMGKDLNGFVSPRSVPKEFWNTTEGYEQKGWYDQPGDPNFPTGRTEPFGRSGPYLTPDGVRIKVPKELPGAIDPQSKTAEMNNLLLVDDYDMPILYYAANTRESSKPRPNIASESRPKNPNSVTGYTGIFYFEDNALFTGGCSCANKACGCAEPWDFGSGKGPLMYPSKWQGKDAPVWPEVIADEPDSWPYYIMNKDAFEATDKRSVVPHRKQSYLLISPGKDGQFGTTDDITNY